MSKKDKLSQLKTCSGDKLRGGHPETFYPGKECPVCFLLDKIIGQRWQISLLMNKFDKDINDANNATDTTF